jgi:hypothetical protein
MAMMARTAHAVPDVHMLATPAASRRSAPDYGLNSLAILLTSGIWYPIFHLDQM